MKTTEMDQQSGGRKHYSKAEILAAFPTVLENINDEVYLNNLFGVAVLAARRERGLVQDADGAVHLAKAAE